MVPLCFAATPSELFDFLGEQEVTIDVGHVHPDGHATLTTTLTGTLTFAGESADHVDAAVVLGFHEHPCTVELDPVAFVAAYAQPTP